jgi:hypothetical protein
MQSKLVLSLKLMIQRVNASWGIDHFILPMASKFFPAQKSNGNRKIACKGSILGIPAGYEYEIR